MIKLEKVIPLPLLENGLNPHSEVFNTEGVVFESSKRYLVEAASGKGKSTLLHLVYGLRNDFQGKIFLEEEQVQNLNADAWATIRQKKLAIVFQDLRLFLHLTARENIELKRQLSELSAVSYQLSASQSLKIENLTPSVFEVENWSKRLGVFEFLDKKCETLSYGQRQRIAIIRALCQPFEMLLLDEPFSHLDKDNIKIAADLILENCDKQHAGFILVSLGETYDWQFDKKLTL